MATYAWTLQGTSPTTIEATDTIQFAGSGGFDSAITVGEYNDTTHVEGSGGANDSSANSPKNSKYLTSSTVDIGAGSVSLSTVADADCPLKINFSHGSAVAITNHILYAYDGAVTTNAPSGVNVQLAEQGDTNWTQAHGSGSALSIADSASATSHDFYILASASPTSVGAKTFTLRDELTYS